MSNVRTLDKTIEKRGFTYQQIERKDNVAIYSQTPLDDNIPVAYEVILIKRGLPHPHTKSDFDKIELYPSDQQFGLNGWSYGNYGDLSIALQNAQNKFNELLNSYGNKNTDTR